MKTAFVFPGQGSQKVGMLQDLYNAYPIVKQRFEEADEALGYSISKLCFEGPDTELVKTANTQPAILTASVACYEVLKEQGFTPDIVGGHSIENKEPIFGMSVTGQVNPNRIWKNKGAQVGDVLVLTKRIGTGIMNNALKADLFPIGTEQAVTSMSTLNRVGAEVAHNFTIHACTDVTGFSLMGHSVEMASASDVTIHIKAYDIPLFDDVIEAAQMGLVPAASYGNRKAITDVQVDQALDPVWTDILFDPQTSGGLLFSVPASEGNKLVEALHESGIDCASIVGTVESFSGLAVRVTE